jgi:hypothetical protein
MDPQEASTLANAQGNTQENTPVIFNPDDEPVLGPRGRLILIVCFTLAAALLVAGMIMLLAMLAYRTPTVGGG